MTKTLLQAVKDAMHTLESVPSLLEKERWEEANSFMDSAVDDLYTALNAVDDKLYLEAEEKNGTE